MTMISTMSNGGCEAIDALRSEFGAILAERIIEAEAAGFLWDGRVKERYLGQHFDVWFGDEHCETELARIVILSFLGGRWHAALCLVDGEGMAVDLLWNRCFDQPNEAQSAFDRAV